MRTVRSITEPRRLDPNFYRAIDLVRAETPALTRGAHASTSRPYLRILSKFAGQKDRAIHLLESQNELLATFFRRPCSRLPGDDIF